MEIPRTCQQVAKVSCCFSVKDRSMRIDLKAVGITGSDAERATVMFLIDFRKRKFNHSFWKRIDSQSYKINVRSSNNLSWQRSTWTNDFQREGSLVEE